MKKKIKKLNTKIIKMIIVVVFAVITLSTVVLLTKAQTVTFDVVAPQETQTFTQASVQVNAGGGVTIGGVQATVVVPVIISAAFIIIFVSLLIVLKR